jgi:hypothetical protein
VTDDERAQMDRVLSALEDIKRLLAKQAKRKRRKRIGFGPDVVEGVMLSQHEEGD